MGHGRLWGCSRRGSWDCEAHSFPLPFCCHLTNCLCAPQPTSSSSCSDCPSRWQALRPECSHGAGARVFAEGDGLFARRVNSTFPLPVPLVGRSLPLPTRQTARAAPFFGVCRRLGQGCWCAGRALPSTVPTSCPTAMAPCVPHAPGSFCLVRFVLFQRGEVCWW